MMPSAAPTSARMLVGIHGLRGLAALLIVLFHLQEIANVRLPQPFDGFVAHFYLSVLLFFVLSAFALSHADATSPTGFNAYLARRFFRIAPLFYTILAWNVIRADGADPLTLLANITFTFNIFPGLETGIVWGGWSVSVEVLFYLCLPMLLFIFSGPRKAFAGLVGATCVSVGIWYFFGKNTSLPQHYAYFFIGSNIAVFLAGIWAYRLYAKISFASQPSRAWLICFGIGSLLYCYFDPFRVHSISAGLYFASWGIAFAVVCLWQAVAPSRALGTRPAQWLGDRSYSIFLLHPIVIELSKPLFATLKTNFPLSAGAFYWLCLLVTLGILFPLAEITYRLIESPGMFLGRRASRFLDHGRKPILGTQQSLETK